jgi:4-amino-4-deoxy-L-arabinose transferase-like glycosyltransferase
VLGFGALVRSAGEYLVIILAVFVLVEAVRRIGFRKAVFSVLLMLVTSLVVVTPWYVRNYQETKAVGLSTTGPYTFLFYHVKDFEMKKHGVSE